MRRVVLAHAVTGVALGALTFFALGGLAIGGLLLAGAGKVAANTASTAGQIVVGGVIALAVSGLVLVFALRQWRAIRVIEVADGAWIHVDRLGARWRVPSGEPLALELRCRRVFFTWGGVPRIMDVVDGWVVAGTRRRRLAGSGTFTYDRVLAALGLDGAAPRRGQRRRYERPRAA